eukprot:14370470-Alexandrium_andersonii.AAC.1
MGPPRGEGAVGRPLTASCHLRGGVSLVPQGLVIAARAGSSLQGVGRIQVYAIGEGDVVSAMSVRAGGC